MASSRTFPESQSADAPPEAEPAAPHATRRPLLAGEYLQQEQSPDGSVRDPAPRTHRWRPFVSARSRILGWSVLLLAAAMAVSTVATHVLLVSRMNARG